MQKITTPPLGFGLGLRAEYYGIIENEKPPVDWFEIITEDYLIPGGRPLFHVEKVRQDYPLVMHGVGLSIGSLDALDESYLKSIKQLAERLEVSWISDHLCWTGIHGKTTHDLLPLPYNNETLQHIVSRIKQAQDFLGRQILLENPSSYLTFQDSDMSEWDFMREMALQADCKILLDVNNVYVSAFNHNFDAVEYLNAIPVDRVQQFHIAGHSNLGDIIVDTHDHKVISDVWNLYETALKRFGNVSTMIERDDRLPPFDQLLNELKKARNIAQKTL
ncbi:MAG: uncharacterized protein K0S08_112 [Gammaproteobacteria bacterium]|jgi:uncharacterized protein (UPF0276 family)|nr:uncharacterized protein [Gammaproteobacteria bacterium]